MTSRSEGAPARLELAEDPMGGWWSAADAPPEARVAYVRADIHEAERALNAELAEALKGVVAALESPEWKEWEGMAVLHETRTRAHELGVEGAKFGYQGPQFMPAVRAALAKAEAREKGDA